MGKLLSDHRGQMDWIAVPTSRSLSGAATAGFTSWKTLADDDGQRIG
jgi:hypothetical protein